MKFLKTTIAAAIVIFGLHSAQAEEIENKFEQLGGPGSLFKITSNRFAWLANERRDGVDEVNVHGSSQPGGDSSVMRRLRLGTLDMSLPSINMSYEPDKFALFNMSYHIAHYMNKTILHIQNGEYFTHRAQAQHAAMPKAMRFSETLDMKLRRRPASFNIIT